MTKAVQIGMFVLLFSIAIDPLSFSLRFPLSLSISKNDDHRYFHRVYKKYWT